MKLDLASAVRGAPWNETVSVAPTASVRHVARILARYQVGAVVVRADDEADAGILSERDVVRFVAAGGDPDAAEARDVMTADLVTIDVAEPLHDAVRAMVSNAVRHLAVVDGDEVVGVLSARDLQPLLAGEPDPADDPDAGDDPLPGRGTLRS